MIAHAGERGSRARSTRGINADVALQVTIALLRNAMIKSSSDLFLVDGFPRALDQAETFERDILPCQMVCPASSSSDLSVCASVCLSGLSCS